MGDNIFSEFNALIQKYRGTINGSFQFHDLNTGTSFTISVENGNIFTSRVTLLGRILQTKSELERLQKLQEKLQADIEARLKISS